MITAKNFTKNYGDFKAVDDISFSVLQGEIVGFVGKNGAGKSTTIRSLLNFIFPTEGILKINDLDSVFEIKEIKKQTGYLSSDAMFYNNITSKDLFDFYCDFQKIDFAKASELFKYFELDENKKLSDLSLGNRKKVAIISLLLDDKSILILDEPTNGLDPFMQEKFFDLLLEKNKNGATIFLSSHNLSEIEKYCSRALIIKDGKIIDDIDLKNSSLKKVQIVTYKTKDGKEEKFEHDGDINEIIKKLSNLDLQSLEIRNRSVEDEFIKYYKD